VATPLDIRLALRAQGYSPVPCKGKVPSIAEWQTKHSPSEDEIPHQACVRPIVRERLPQWGGPPNILRMTSEARINQCQGPNDIIAFTVD